MIIYQTDFLDGTIFGIHYMFITFAAASWILKLKNLHNGLDSEHVKGRNLTLTKYFS